MEQIVSYVKEPAWWFSTFFIAIVASVIAGFAKDKIEIWFGTLSGRMRESQSNRAAKRQAFINALADNEGLLIMSLIRATVLTVLTMFGCTLWVLYQMFEVMIRTWCGSFPSAQACTVEPSFLHSLLAAIFAVVITSMAYKSSTASKIALQGLKAYRKKRDLPWGL